LKADREKLLNDINQTQQLIKTKRITRKTTLEQLELINSELALRDQLISKLEYELEQIELNITSTEESINKLEDDIDLFKKEYAKLLQDTYRRRNAMDELVFYFSAGSFSETYRRYRLLKEYARYRKHQADELIASQQKLIALVNHVQSQKEQKEVYLNSIKEEKQHLDSSKVQQAVVVQKLQSEETWLLKSIQEKNDQAKELENKIMELIASAGSGNDGVDFDKYKGKLIWPVTKGLIISNFGEHPHPVLKSVVVKNNGIDIQVVGNETVFSVHNGDVSRIVGIPGYNTAVIVRHGKFLTVYANLKSVTVKQGDQLMAGDPVGLVFKESEQLYGILHFEVWEGNKKLNPSDWLVP
jgi:septal ring factor EnvC (AmiA/AmiB activator)